MPDQAIALDPDPTVVIPGPDSAITIVMPAWQALRAEAPTGGLVRPGCDCVAPPMRHRRPPRQHAAWLRRLARLVSHGAPLVVGLVAVVCIVVFLGTVQP